MIIKVGISLKNNNGFIDFNKIVKSLRVFEKSSN